MQLCHLHDILIWTSKELVTAHGNSCLVLIPHSLPYLEAMPLHPRRQELPPTVPPDGHRPDLQAVMSFHFSWVWLLRDWNSHKTGAACIGPM